MIRVVIGAESALALIVQGWIVIARRAVLWTDEYEYTLKEGC